jgi:hypothetical protein
MVWVKNYTDKTELNSQLGTIFLQNEVKKCNKEQNHKNKHLQEIPVKTQKNP